MLRKKEGFCGWLFSAALEERFSLVCLFLLGQVTPPATLQYQVPAWETSCTRQKWSAPALGETSAGT